jgi:predicted phage terminase large subunit-like protein
VTVSVRLPTREELDQALVQKGGLYEFMRLAWPAVEPGKFIPNWHLAVVCQALERVSAGQERRLVINIPPGCGKSSLVSVFWHAWLWGARAEGPQPWRKSIAASFDLALTMRDSLKLRGLIETPWYAQRWGKDLGGVGVLKTKDAQETQGIWWTTGRGFRFSTTTPKGRLTGWHGHDLVLDDPVKPQEVTGGGPEARRVLDAAWRWWNTTASTRKADPEDFNRVVIMQRLHTEDVAARCIKEGYTLLSLPMEWSKAKSVVPDWTLDPRTKPGELLWPGRFSQDVVTDMRTTLGPRDASAQLDQDPVPDQGVVFQREWFNQRHREIPSGAEWIQSWDLTSKGGTSSDYCCGLVMAKAGSRVYVVDQVWSKLDFVGQVRAILDLSNKWPQTRVKLIEDKANGSAVESVLRDQIPGVVLVNPEGGKVARANAVTGYCEAKNVSLPEGADWALDFVEELVSFPVSAHDDRVDAFTQGLFRLYSPGKKSNWAEALAKVQIK